VGKSGHLSEGVVTHEREKKELVTKEREEGTCPSSKKTHPLEMKKSIGGVGKFGKKARGHPCTRR